MRALEEVVQTKWSEKDRKISALVSPLPLCPRYLDSRTFLINYRFSPSGAVATSIHEILHFIYFKKWKEIFPEAKREEFDSPHLVWKLSEMVPSIVLGDPCVQAVFKCDFKSHEIYHHTTIDGRPLLSRLQEIFDERTDFADFLKKSWKFVNENKEDIP